MKNNSKLFRPFFTAFFTVKKLRKLLLSILEEDIKKISSIKKTKTIPSLLRDYMHVVRDFRNKISQK